MSIFSTLLIAEVVYILMLMNIYEYLNLPECDMYFYHYCSPRKGKVISNQQKQKKSKK